MERLTQEDFRRLLQCQREISACLDLESFAAQVVSAVSNVLPGDVVACTEIDLETRRIAVTTEPPEALPPDADRILARHLDSHPLIEHYRRTRDSRAVKLSELVTRRQFHRLPVYQELYRSMAGEHLMTVWLPPSSSPLISIGCIRSQPDFSERDRQLLNLLHPHFIQAHHNAQKVSGMKMRLDTLEQVLELSDRGTLLVNDEGRVRWASGRALQWMEEYFGMPADAPSLPEELWHWVQSQSGSIERRISRFNPIGHLAEGINEEIPNLTLKGFLRNNTELNLHSKSDDVGLGHRRKDWRAQQIKWLAELKMTYQLTERISIVNVNNFLYDAFYDWQSTSSNADKIDRDASYYHETKRVLRELYLKATYGNWDVILGKQQVVWGKMDGKFLDIINPEDSRDGPQHEIDDYEWTRIPTWMLNFTYNWPSSYLNFLWIPDFEPSRPPVYDSPYWPPAIRIDPLTNSPFPPIIHRTTADKPSMPFVNHELGVRYNVTRGIWDVSFIYFHGWDDLPTNFFRSGTIDPVSKRISTMTVEPQYTRIHQLGLATTAFFSGLDRQWIWRLESMVTLNKYLPLKSMPGMLPWRAGKGNVTKRNLLKSAVSIETTLFDGRVNVIFQPVFNYVFGFDNNINARHGDIIFLWNISQAIHRFDDRLRYSLTWVYFPFFKMNGLKQKYDVSYELSDHLSLRLRYTGYSGHQDEVYGMYDDWDNLGIRLEYRF